MKPKAIMKIVTDFCMTVLLMLLMAFELIGRTAHEWIGAGMFVLFILHHIFNIKWSRNLTKGIYSPFRIVQTCLAVLVLLSMLGSILSSIFISREVFSFLPITGGRRFGRTLHMLSAYWGFIFLSLHLGIHWSTMMGLFRKKFSGKSMVRSAILKIIGIGIAAYGVYSLIVRDILSYLFLQTQFVFFDFEEPLFLFFLDYLAMMGLFVWIGYYSAEIFKKIGRKNKSVYT